MPTIAKKFELTADQGHPKSMILKAHIRVPISH